MKFMRRAKLRRLTTGVAIAATFVHVFALSLHIAMITSIALAGKAIAADHAATIVICAPGKRSDIALPKAVGIDHDSSNPFDIASTTICPLCTGGGNTAFVVPAALPQPLFEVNSEQSSFLTTATISVVRYEVLGKQSRGPPHQI